MDMSSYKLVQATFKALEFSDDLLELFIVQQVTDSTIECCLRNSFFADMLQEIIPLDQRNKFLKKFSELKYPVVPEGDTVLAVIFRSSHLRMDVDMLKICRLVSKSWNIYATESLAACSNVRLEESGSKLTSFRTLLHYRTLGPFQNYPTPFQNYIAFARSFTDRDFVDLLLNNPMRGLDIRLSYHDENNPNFDLNQFNLVIKANQANIENLSVTSFNRDIQWDEGDEAFISDDIQLASLKTLALSDNCNDSISACKHQQFMKKILSMCKSESIELEPSDGAQFVNLLSQDNTQKLRHFGLNVLSLSSDSWANLEKLRFPRLTSLSFDMSSGPSDDVLPKWDSFCENISPLLKIFKTTCPISVGAKFIFPNLKRIEFNGNNILSALPPERFPALVEVKYSVGELHVLQEGATSPHLGVQSLKLTLGSVGSPCHYELLLLLTHMKQQFPNVTSLSLGIGEFGYSALPVVFETFPKLKRLGLDGSCNFCSFSGLDKATIISHVEDGWPIERIPRRKSIMDFIELEVITFGVYFGIDPDMILYCLPRVPNLRQISFYWNESLSVPLLRDSVGHLERIVIIISKYDKDIFEDVIVQVGEMLPNTCVRYVES